MKKIFIYFSVILYLFLATGLKTFALCFDLPGTSCHKMAKIECSCCHHKMKQSNLSVHIESNSATNDCKNCIKFPLSSNNLDQTISTFNQPVIHIKTLCNIINPLSNSIIFRNISLNQIYRKPIISLNKNLDLLSTVILLS